MPKALSLKKGGVKPSQKSITQFFKNNETQAQKVVPDGQRPAPDNVQSSSSLKRKAISPVSKNLFGNLGHSKVPNPSRSPRKSPKKIKKSNEIYPQKAIVTLQKENGSNQPAQKISNHENFINVDPENHGKDMEKRESRSPLSQVSSNDINCDLNKLFDLENVKLENHVESIKTPQKNGTPNKAAKHEMSCSPVKVSSTHQKSSPVQTELRRSPRIAKLKTPDKSIIVPPIKDGSTEKVALDFDNVDDMFGDEWHNVDIPDSEVLVDNLDLSLMKRCEVVSVQHQATCTELRLKSDDGQTGSCFIEGLWRETPLSPGEIVSATCARDAAGRHVISACAGLLVLRPDHLMSTTSVVAGVFCRRKAVLQERFKGIDAANHAMTIGILIHELVQATLTRPVPTGAALRARTDALVARSTRALHAAALATAEARASVETYLRPLEEFMRTYVGPPGKANGGKDKWPGHIDDILDIEENVCCPQLGLKGKIDATLKVTIHERKGSKTAIVPLELKSGRASGSSEHRGQLVLYNMMLSAQRDCAPTEPGQRGLLLYLKDRVDLREVSCGYPEKRDLIMLRNQLVQHLSSGPGAVDSEKLTDIEEAAHLLRQTLPDPVHHHNACSKCPYLTICSLHLWHTDGPTVSPDHPLEKLREQALGHLSSDHVKYFLHWTALLRMEERVQMTSAPLHALWTEDPVKRRKRGACTADLKLRSVVASDDRFVHVFEKADHNEVVVNDSKPQGPQEGEFSIVSVKNRPWIAAGVISLLRGKELHIMLERDLSRRQSKDTVYHIDTYESYATTVQNLTNLGVLMEDSDRAFRLRRLIIDKEPPEFELKLPREVGRFGAKLMKTLNIEQQRAVLRTLAARDYALLQGLPGTGKTQTISVLIQMLVALKQRVLVTAHTHSAVDTVLTRLPSSLRVMRLGSSARVAASLQPRCEQPLTEACTTPEALQDTYDSMEVVGVTCLGASHAVLARTTFDVCIVDEATQVPQCTVLRALLSATRFVLVGDPEQLPPVVRSRSARRLGMEASLFHRLNNANATSTLQLQYRMNAPLTTLANSVAYGGRLTCANAGVAEATHAVDTGKLASLYANQPWLLQACSPDLQHAALFIDVGETSEPDGNKLCDKEEACMVLALVDAFRQCGVNPSDIGVIAPYREQVALLRRAVARLRPPAAEVSTVDQFQGRDKSVILYSCTRSDQHAEVKEGEVLNDQRRLAVSVTRAKHKLIFIGHSHALNRYAPLQSALDACTTLRLEDDVKEEIKGKYAGFVA